MNSTMRNTVLEEYDATSIVEDIRLNVQHNNSREVMVVVEGEDDEKALKKFFNLQVVDFFPTCNCLAVRESMRIVSSDEQLKDRVVGIKDGDFDHLEGIRYDDIPNLLLTDTHDIETMMLTPHVCRCLCLETIQREYPNLFFETASSLKNLSYIRYYNDKIILNSEDSTAEGINFNGLVIGNVIPDRTPVDMSKWLEAVKQLGNTNKALFPTLPQMRTFMNDNPISEEQLSLFTNGHDLVFAIRDILHSLSDKAKKYSDKDIAFLIRANFDRNDFRNTKLYENIVVWNNGKFDLWAA